MNVDYGRSSLKSISHALPLLSRFLSFKVGNEENIWLWGSYVDGDSSFDLLFPHLYRLIRSQNISIASMAFSSSDFISWNLNFLRTLDDHKMDEMVSLLAIFLMA